MKRLVFALWAACFAHSSLTAAVILSDSFNYPDGSIVGAPGSPWQNHSGTLGQANVLSGRLQLTGGETEDVNAPLTGAPYDTTNNPSATALYASIKVQFTSLPGGAGTYFAHFKDNGIQNFRCRLFALTNGTAQVGKFRFGIGSTNSASTSAGFSSFPADQDLNTTNTLVIRIDLLTGASTLWLDPTAETDLSVSSTSDPGNVLGVTTFAFRQSSGIGTMLIDDLKVGTSFADVAGPNNPPSISLIPNQQVPAGTATVDIPFTIGDAETLADNLTLSASSSNQGLAPDGSVAFSGSGFNRTVRVTPVAGQQGVAVITVTVTDEGGVSATTSFQVAVGIPTISDIRNQSTPSNTVAGPITFTVGDTETPASDLAVTATSSNQGLVPDANISAGGAGAQRTLTITPAADQLGLATITVTASDGISTASDTFVLTVNPLLGLLRSDDFNRADGPIVDGSGAWLNHSGLFQEAQIVSASLQLSENLTEDVSTEMPPFQASTPVYRRTSGTILYASLTVKFIDLPSSSGSYFAHFKDGTTSGFRARVFASTQNAALGFFRLGIANNAASVSVNSQIATDLATNTTYLVVVRYNVGTGESTLWINPATESSPSVSASDNPSPVDIYSFSFRENSGIGVVNVDDLKIGTSFADLVGGASGAPTISTLSNQTTRVNLATDPQPFTIGDAETPANALTLSGTSSNPGLVPDGNILFGGADADRTVTVLPATDQSGSATITVTVTDLDGKFATSSFVVTVLPANTPPTITALPHTNTLMNTSVSDIAFTIFDLETVPDSLTVTAVSGNQTLLPNANVVLSGSDSNRTVTLTPAADQVGVAIVTITVSDGAFSTNAVFTLMVIPSPGVIFYEPFDYPDGSIVNNSGGLWNTHSGTAGEMQVVSGQLQVSSVYSEDVNARLIGAPYPAASGTNLYAKFALNLAALPTSLEGTYFAHFKDNTAQNFRARIFAGTTNAADGFFRLGIANTTTNYTQVAVDLSPGTTYALVTRYNVGTGVSTLWVNPSSESDPGATAADAANPTSITSYAFRQAVGYGILNVDDLVVGTSFANVMGTVAPPAQFQISIRGNGLEIAWPIAVTGAGFVLETTDTLTPPNWQPPVNLPITTVGNMNILSITNPTGTAFFRLRR